MSYPEEDNERFLRQLDEYAEQENRDFLAELDEPLGTPPRNWDYISRLPMEFIFDETFHDNVTPWDDFDLLGADDADLLALEEGMPDMSSSTEDSIVLPQPLPDAYSSSVSEPQPATYLDQSSPVPPTLDAPAYDFTPAYNQRLSDSLERELEEILRPRSRIPRPVPITGDSPASLEMVDRRAVAANPSLRSRIPVSSGRAPTYPRFRRRVETSPPILLPPQQGATSSPMPPTPAATGGTENWMPSPTPAMSPSWNSKHITDYVKQRLRQKWRLLREKSLSEFKKKIEESTQETRRLNEERAAASAAESAAWWAGLRALSAPTPERTPPGQPVAAVSSRIRVPLTPGTGSITSITIHESTPTVIPSASTPRGPVTPASGIASPISPDTSSIRYFSGSPDSIVPADFAGGPNIQNQTFEIASPEYDSPLHRPIIIGPFESGSSGSMRAIGSFEESDNSMFREVVEDPQMYSATGYLDFNQYPPDFSLTTPGGSERVCPFGSGLSGPIRYIGDSVGSDDSMFREVVEDPQMDSVTGYIDFNLPHWARMRTPIATPERPPNPPVLLPPPGTSWIPRLGPRPLARELFPSSPEAAPANARGLRTYRTYRERHQPRRSPPRRTQPTSGYRQPWRY